MNPSESLKSSDAITIRQPSRDQDLENRLELARAKQRNGDKPGIPWEQANKGIANG